MAKDPPSHPHDALIRRTFGVPEHAAGELKAVLPPAVCASVRWETLTLSSTSVVDPELRHRHMDLLYSVQMHDQEAYLFVLLEAQSTVDDRMSLRLFIYMARIWERWLRRAPSSAVLPPIVPIVLYHGDQKWHRSVEFSDQFKLDAELAKALAPFLPRFRFVLDDLSMRSDEQLLSRDLSALAQVTLGALKYGKTSYLTDRFVPAWANSIRALLEQPKGFVELDTILYYLFIVNPNTDIQTLENAMQQYAGSDAASAVITAGDRLRAEGREEGREEGRQEGLARAVLRLLEARGFAVADTTRVRIEQCSDLQKLEQWLCRAPTVATADEIFSA